MEQDTRSRLVAFGYKLGLIDRRRFVFERYLSERLVPEGTRRGTAWRDLKRASERGLPLLVVIGCGRSGTQYTASLFQRAKVRSRHEYYVLGGRQRVLSSWPLSGDGVDVPWPPSTEMIAHRKLIFVHQVRHPLAVISSSQTLEAKSWRYIARQIDADATRPLRRAMQYWLHWNVMAERKALMTYRVEQMEQMLPVLVEKGELPVSLDAVVSAFRETSQTTNKRRHTDYSWADLEAEDAGLTSEIRALAAKYGYAAES
jgi:hypothetical protein